VCRAEGPFGQNQVHMVVCDPREYSVTSRGPAMLILVIAVCRAEGPLGQNEVHMVVCDPRD